jgi:hypothetical protein
VGEGHCSGAESHKFPSRKTDEVPIGLDFPQRSLAETSPSSGSLPELQTSPLSFFQDHFDASHQ